MIVAATAVASVVGAAPAAAGTDVERGVGAFITDGDNVHLSSTPPPTASGHGCWHKIRGDGSVAVVTIWLQARHGNGSWSTVVSAKKRLKSAKGLRGCPSSARVNARKACSGGIIQHVHWRSIIDVDIVGVDDTPEQAYTKAVDLWCRPTTSGSWS